MARLRTYGRVFVAPGGRSFYSNPRKRARKPRASLTPALKKVLKQQRETRREEYALALTSAQDVIHTQALKLRETFGGHSADYYTQEIMQCGRLAKGRRKPSGWNAYLRNVLKTRNAELSPGQPRLRSNNVAGEAAREWNAMDAEKKAEITNPLIEELVLAQKEADTKPRITPVHVLNDVSATVAKIKHELDALHARTGFETILMGVRSSADHYTAPMAYTSSSKIATFFDVVAKKPIPDLMTSLEAFCLSGVDGVIEKLVKDGTQLKGKVSKLILDEMLRVSDGQVKRVIYKDFDECITRKHGIIVERWPLRRFCCPSEIASQMELNVLLESWQSGVTRFRKMGEDEYMAWMDDRARRLEPPPNDTADTRDVQQPAALPSQPPGQDISPPSAASSSGFNVIHFGSPAPLQTSNQANGVVKKQRKTRSDKGKPRKKQAQVPGTTVFYPGAQ